MDEVAWGALAVALSVLGGVWTWHAYRAKGLPAGMRGVAWTLLPIAAYLTNTLELGGEILEAFVDWGARLVFSPVVWLGVIVAGVSGILFVTSGLLGRRGISAGSTTARRAVSTRSTSEEDEIEALLRERGIR